MSTVLVPTLPARSPAIFPLTVEQYHRMIDAGILQSGDAVELIEGQLVCKMTRNPPHRITQISLRDRLLALLPPGWHLQDQEAITLDQSEPEPDLSIIRGSTRDYAKRHPGSADIGLVIEVSDSTLGQDRGLKLQAYARASLVEYWIVNLTDERIEVYTNPSGPAAVPGYSHRIDYDATQSVPLRLDGQLIGEIAVQSVLP